MIYEVNPFDIEIGQYKVMINLADARELGLNAGDRVRVRAKGASLTAILDITTQMVKPGQIGIFTEAYQKMGDAKEVDVAPAPKPASVAYIKKLMDEEKLAEDQIRTIVQDIVDNNLSDVEISAYLTTLYIRNFDSQETEWLTRAMIETGERIHFDTHPVVDKHSIGGVPGNKVSLLVVPIVAAAGLLIPKTSSRAITGAGGTSDLMEILAPVEFSADEIKEIAERVGGLLAWGGATNIAPADDKLITTAYSEGVFERLSGQRLRRELEHLLAEPHPTPALGLVAELGLLPAITPRLKWSEKTSSYLLEVRVLDEDDNWSAALELTARQCPSAEPC